MNIILIKAEQMIDESRARLGRRVLDHVRRVLGAKLGDTLQVGLLGGKLGHGTLKSWDSEALELDCVFDQAAPPKPKISLLMALPRPQTLKKVLLEASSLGVARFLFIRTRRTDKSYFQSKLLKDEKYRDFIHLGLEQAKDTYEPPVTFHRRFRPLVEEGLENLISSDHERLLADPEGQTPIHQWQPKGGKVLVAIGPEGGWVPFEKELLRAHGFHALSLGPRILRVETASLAILSQIQVLKHFHGVS